MININYDADKNLVHYKFISARDDFKEAIFGMKHFSAAINFPFK